MVKESEYPENSFIISDRISNTNISGFVEDKFGHIWILTEYGANRYNGSDYHIYFSTNNERTILNNQSNSATKDKDGNIWFATVSGICYYNYDRDEFVRIPMDDDYSATLTIITLEDGSLVCRKSNREIVKYDNEVNRFVEILPEKNENNPLPSYILPDRGQYFWAINSGLVQSISSEDGSIQESFQIGEGLSGNSNQAVIDNSGNLWYIDSGKVMIIQKADHSVSGFSGGVSTFENNVDAIYSAGKFIILRSEGLFWFYDQNTGKLVSQNDSSFLYTLPSFTPKCFFMDSKENLWVGSSDNGYAICSAKEHLFDRNAKLHEKLKDTNVRAVASYRNTVFSIAGDNELVVADINSKDEINSYNLSSLGVLSQIVSLSLDHLVVSSSNNMYSIKLEADNTIKVLDRVVVEGNITKLFISREGELYLGLSNGSVKKYSINAAFSFKKDAEIVLGHENRNIYDICQVTDGGICISQFREDICLWYPSQNRIVPMNYREQLGELYHIIDIEPAGNGDLWIGTRDFGVVKFTYTTQKFELFKPGSNKRISAIGISKDGNVWVSTYYGLYVISPGSNTAVQYLYDSGLENIRFHGRAVCTLEDGTVVFAGTNGITTCHIQKNTNVEVYPIVFENLNIKGKDIHPSEDSEISRNISSNPEIVLKHNERDFSISFATLNYAQEETVYYRYRLGKEWIRIGRKNSIDFSNLTTGRHKLEIGYDSVADGSSGENHIYIKVLPHPSLSTAALILYTLILILIGYFILRGTKERMKMRMAIAQLDMEKEHEKYINKMNMNFFANMAHEFRSPLTLVDGPLKQLEESEDISRKDRQIISVMKISVERLMKLVNQILDFNSLDNNNLKLKVDRNCNITLALARCVESIGVNAKRENITVSTVGLDVPYTMPADADKIESIMSNILSNALKYCSRDKGKGKIEVSFEEKGNGFVEIHVDNDGEPIEKEDLERIFDRHYQLRRHTLDTRVPGTGIGLYFARTLAERMHGSLSAMNLPGNMVRFTLTLPTDPSLFSEDELITAVHPISDDSEAESTSSSARSDGDSSEETFDSGKKTVLVVDDDTDIANYLKILLAPYYNVKIAYNAEDALALTSSKEMPDLVLSDIVMQGMDGTKLCQKIKSNILTSHIPVILETAKVGLDNEIEGLKSGADAYVTKPFDPSYLLTLINSIMKNREAVRGELVTNTDLEEADKKYLSPQDADFMRKLYGIMEKEMSNSELDIDKVAEHMAISRSKLFYKIKSLTGMTPMLLFRTYRLNIAAKLLKSGEYNVSEVYEKVGFNSLSYFSRAFKAQFGVLPKDTKQD